MALDGSIIFARAPSNPGTVASTLGSPRDQSHTTSEPSNCHICGSSSVLIRSQCQEEGCDCFGEHAQVICHQCPMTVEITPRRYNAPEGIDIHNWRVAHFDRPNRGARRGYYLFECSYCRTNSIARVDHSSPTPTLDYSTGYNSPCDSRDHNWVLTSVGAPGNPDAHLYICINCNERLQMPDGSRVWETSSRCPGIQQRRPGITIKSTMKKNILEPDVQRPTRFEREPVI